MSDPDHLQRWNDDLDLSLSLVDWFWGRFFLATFCIFIFHGPVRVQIDFCLQEGALILPVPEGESTPVVPGESHVVRSAERESRGEAPEAEKSL